jgi:TetR/AcrR family transcriptional regulator, repressor for neighboring sulfatase
MKAQDALVAAMIRLMKKRAISDISVREVAAEAGVNHGLVHRHFGAKDELVKAAVRQISEDIHHGSPDGTMSASTFAYLRAHPEVARLVARGCLDGPHQLLDIAAPPPERLDAIVAPIRETLERAGLGALDAHLLNGIATCALLGWFAFKPLVKKGFGLPADADDQLARLLELLDATVARAAPATTPASAAPPARGDLAEDGG